VGVAQRAAKFDASSAPAPCRSGDAVAPRRQDLTELGGRSKGKCSCELEPVRGFGCRLLFGTKQHEQQQCPNIWQRNHTDDSTVIDDADDSTVILDDHADDHAYADLVGERIWRRLRNHHPRPSTSEFG